VVEPVDLRPLFTPLRASLTELLQATGPDGWQRPTACEGWSVADVASHLLGVELGNVSRRRDTHRLDPGPGENLGVWLAAFNEDWVRACRRLSSQVLISLLDLAGTWFDEFLVGLDLDAMGPPIWWIGPDPAPVWLDVAREYSERWVHQQQLRDALDKPGLTDGTFLHPVLLTFIHALPHALASVERPVGTTAEFVASGDGGGMWHVIRTATRWELRPGEPANEPACRVSGPASNIWRLYANYPGVQLSADGDHELAAAMFTGRAVID